MVETVLGSDSSLTPAQYFSRAEGPQKPGHDTDYERFAESKSSIHTDMGTYSGAVSAVGAASPGSSDDGAFSPSLAAGLRRFLPPREPRRERFFLGWPSTPTASTSTISDAGTSTTSS